MEIEPSNLSTETGVCVRMRTRALSPDRLNFIRQSGATDVFVNHAGTAEEPDVFNDHNTTNTLVVGRNAILTVDDPVTARKRVKATGL